MNVSTNTLTLTKRIEYLQVELAQIQELLKGDPSEARGHHHEQQVSDLEKAVSHLRQELLKAK